MRSIIIATVCCFLLLGTAMLAFAGDRTSEPASVSWEYRIMSGEELFEGKDYAPENAWFDSKKEESAYFARCLNELGADGWQLITENKKGYIFKRPKIRAGT